MKLFGEYLVETKLITESTLLEALIQQIATTPSDTEIVFEHELLDVKSFLEVLTIQVRDKVDFKSACEKKGVWTSELEDKISNILKEKKAPLGQILHREGKIKLVDLTKAFDEFVSVCGKEGKTPLAAPAAAPTITTTAVPDYLELFSTEKKESFFKFLDAFAAADVDVLTLELHGLENAAGRHGAVNSQKVAGACETLLSAFKNAGLPSETSAMTQSFVKDALEDLWVLRESVYMSGSEELVWASLSVKLNKMLEDMAALESQTQKKAITNGKVA